MERQDIHLSVFFAITNPKVHPTWSEPWLRRVVDKVHTYKVALWQLERLKRLEWSGNYEEKGVYDYTYALQHCHDTGAPWIVMFEGDVIVADGWVVKTMQGIRAIERKMRKSTKDWMYMRLFNQERSTGWSSKHIGGNNEHWIAVGIGASLVILAFAAKRRSQAVKQHLDNWTLAVVCVVAVPALVILFFQAGKASMLPPSPGVFEQGYGCCSQAMVFPRGQVPGLIQFLQKKKRGQVDLLINDYVNDEKLSRFSLYPVQVQHVGENQFQCVWDSCEANAGQVQSR